VFAQILACSAALTMLAFNPAQAMNTYVIVLGVGSAVARRASRSTGRAVLASEEAPEERSR
jgi:hypothetical protein